MLIGSENVARWATLTIFAEIGEKPRELLLTRWIVLLETPKSDATCATVQSRASYASRTSST
ncbi:MAG: hypothetical protein ACLP01_19540 [Solirubrobacteraceae bacterium]